MWQGNISRKATAVTAVTFAEEFGLARFPMCLRLFSNAAGSYGRLRHFFEVDSLGVQPVIDDEAAVVIHKRH